MTSARREVLSPESGADAGEPRKVDPAASPAEEAEEASLRPRQLAEFVGQSQLVEHLAIVLEAARRRGQPADHLLFAGPPGLGKTSLAGIVAVEMAVGFRITSGPVLARAGDLAALLTDLQDGDVLFVDEIHRLSRTVEELLYPAMEDGKIDILIGKGPTARSIRLDLPRFTLVGATTRTGLVAGPLRDRFGFVGRLDLYGPGDLRAIVERSARLLGVQIDTGASTCVGGSHRSSNFSSGPGIRWFISGVIDSDCTPPAISTRSMPEPIWAAALPMAVRLPAQCRFTAWPGMSSMPVAAAAYRAKSPPP